jgi:hypothetical protein
LDEAAQITAQYGGGWLIGETLAAGRMARVDFAGWQGADASRPRSMGSDLNF